MAAQQLSWTAAHSPDAVGQVVYLAGRLVAANGTERVVVAALDPLTLTTKWIKVIGEGGERALALVSSPAGKGQVAVAGWQGSGASTAAWLAVLDGDGTLLRRGTEGQVGPRAYMALMPGPQGELVAAGGAEKLGTNSGELTTYGWFARWDGAGKQLLQGRALMAGKKQIFGAGIPYAAGYLLAGSVGGLGLNRQGWLVQVNANGLIPCGL